MRTRLLTLLFVLTIAASVHAAVITVDTSSPRQSWEGWGASDISSFDALAFEEEAGKPGPIPIEGQKAILELYYRDLGMNFVRFCPWGYEPENDNDDPFTLNESAFKWEGRNTRLTNSLDNVCRDHLVLGKEFRSKTDPFVFYPSINNWESWMAVNPKGNWGWNAADGKFKPEMVEEYAEHAFAAVKHVKEKFGYTIPYWALFNEPSNNARPSKETNLALVLACGRRFKQHKISTKLVICDDVTPEGSAEAIEYVLADKEARNYVGAVSYHRYCGDFVLERVKPMLQKLDKGDLLVSAPVSFYDTARKYGKSVWVSEQCSYGDEGITMYDAGRARAGHICDEINNAGVNSFNFMLTWFIERGRPGFEECPIYMRFKDGHYSGCEINAFGAWLRHFTRYIRPSMVRLPVIIDDNKIRAVAFRDRSGKKGNAILVVVSNNANPTEISARLNGMRGSGKVSVFRTEPEHIGLNKPVLVMTNGILKDTIPGYSVTTYSVVTQ